MARFRLLLVVLCLGLLGVLPFVVSQPKPEAAAPAVQRETTVQRQMGAQGALQQESMRAKVGMPLTRVRTLVDAGEYKQAFAVLDELDAIPDKTAHESAIVSQMRGYATVKSSGIPPETR